MRNPPRITVYDRAFVRRGWVGDPQSVSLNLRHNQQPTAQVGLRSDHPALAWLLEPGARMTFEYAGLQVLSGVVDGVDSTGAVDGVTTLQVSDDYRLLVDRLGWQAPASPISDQSGAEYDTVTGPAETVVKTFLGRAITRMGGPISVAPDQGRGQVITVKMRMHQLADRLYPLVDQAGIGVSVRQVGAGLVVDCYESAWYPQTLTSSSGIVTDFAWNRQAPTVTRVVVGGQGEGTARAFVSVVDAALESEWGIKREQFLDATDVEDALGLPARGQAALAAGAAKTGLSLTLAETDTFRYGDALRVGDTVTTRLVPGAEPITDVLREARIVWNVSEGLTVTPVVGERTDDPSHVLARAVASVARNLRNLQAGK